jgi:DNA polymerase-3 subunit gamma/tau
MTEPPDSATAGDVGYQVSARRYRPQAFADVVGQPHVVRTLTNAIRSGRIAHAYLFSGIRGVGKTTVARIFAKALNCAEGPTPEPCGRCEPCRAITDGSAPDVREIDGASNNSVDDVRDLSENIRYRPLAARYRIYIIDEVHMLSGPAFNALLKTLEEPPPHAVFIFATTETQKIPQTILSRCQHHAFRRVGRAEIAAHLAAVAEGGGIPVTPTAVGLIARAADGSLRDALSLFDQAVSFGGGQVADADVGVMLGRVDEATLHALAGEVLGGDAAAALTRLKNLVGAGQDLQILAAALVEHFRNLVVCAVSDAPETLIDLSPDDVADLKSQAVDHPREVLEQVLGLMTDAQERCRRALLPRFVLEAALVRACEAPRLVDLGELAGRLDALAGGVQAAPPVASAPPAARRPAPAEPPRRTEAPRPAPPRPDGPARAMVAGASLPERAAPPPAAAAPEGAAEAAPESAGTRPAPDASPKEIWAATVREIHRRRPALAPYLEQGSVRAAARGRVEVAFQPAYEVMLDIVRRPENQAFVAQVAGEVAGRPIEVAFVRLEAAGAGPVATLAQEFEAEAAEVQRREVETAMELPFIRDALETFGGEVVELRKAEPERP